MGQSRHPWKTRNMLLFAILLLGVGIQAAPQNYERSYQPKCSYLPEEQCTTVFENVQRKVTDVECHPEYKEECHTEYTTECHKVPTTRKVKQTEQKCTKDYYGKETCSSSSSSSYHHHHHHHHHHNHHRHHRNHRHHHH